MTTHTADNTTTRLILTLYRFCIHFTIIHGQLEECIDGVDRVALVEDSFGSAFSEGVFTPISYNSDAIQAIGDFVATRS